MNHVESSRQHSQPRPRCDRSEVAPASGRAAIALSLAERVLASPRRLLDDEMNTESAAAAFRDTLARAYLALGRKQQAAAAFDALVKSGFEGVHLPITFVRSLYTLGRLEIELGDRQRGRAHLQQFLEYWSHSDWSLDEVRDARTRLAGQTRG